MTIFIIFVENEEIWILQSLDSILFKRKVIIKNSDTVPFFFVIDTPNFKRILSHLIPKNTTYGELQYGENCPNASFSVCTPMGGFVIVGVLICSVMD